MFQKTVSWSTLTIRGLAITLLLVAGLSATAQAEQAMPVAGSLEVLNLDQQAFTGLFARAGSMVYFEGEKKAPTLFTVRLEVNGQPIEASWDFKEGVARLDGGDTALFLADRDALAALSYQLESEITKGLSGQKVDLVYRLANMLSEAPLGFPIGSREIRRPETSGFEQAVPALFARDPEALEEGGISLKASTVKACQQDGDDGITYLGGACSWLYYNSYHDADAHCYGNYQVYAGCNRGSGTWQDCLGRCGGGCGSGGKGTYSTDCKDHDRCCRYHGGCTNPWDGECGDEYWSADDDYAWGSTNCNGC